MAGGGQTRIPTDRFIDPSPMGGAMPMAANGGIDPINRRGGDHVANLAEGKPAFAPRPLKASASELLSANSGRIPGVDFPTRGGEGSFYNQPSQTLDAQGNLSQTNKLLNFLNSPLSRDPSVLDSGRKPMPSPPGQNAQGNLTPMPSAPMPGGKGGQNAEIPRPTPAPAPSTQYSPMAAPMAAPAQPQGFDVNQAAAGGLQKAFQGTEAAMQGPNIGQFMNPYTKQVTQNTLTDLERQRQMQMNTLGAQASNARAFGGSRHGVAEALTNEGFARQGAQTFGNLQQQGFNTALQAAQNQQQMQMGGAAQLGQLGQQAFGTSQAIQQQQGQQGLLQQGIQQALIDAAKQQYAGYTNAPAAALNAPLQALGVAQQGGAKDVVQSQNPGLLSYLQTAAMMCWVAREVYGEQDPKWMQFREWVIGHSPDWFYKAYSNYGEKFAKVVRKVPAIKIILRPFMDAKRKSIGYKA